MEQSNIITIIHFNDVYNITPYDKDPVGGAARFVAAIKQRYENPLVLFSGDAFSPSIMSTFTKGKQMVPILNACNIQCAVIGNHDFDFGVDNLVKLMAETNFPWLMSNVYDNFTGEPLGGGLVTHSFEWQGKKIGLVGLVEEDWAVTLSTVDPNNITVNDFVEEGQTLAKELKEDGADFVIALTHMRWPNDEKLANSVDEIDLFLGGHDHDTGHKVINGKHVLKSGSDFRHFGVITLDFSSGQADVVKSVEFFTVTSSLPEDPEIKDIVASFNDVIGQKMDVPLGYINAELDGRFSSVRTGETNLGNFITDIMARATDSDIALLNSGTLRSDRIHPPGSFKMKDLLAILPMMDSLVVLEINADQLLEALENGVAKYPALEGRFPQISGVTFKFSASQPGGKRIDRQSVFVQGVPLAYDRTYRLCTKSYLAEGKDGYDVFKKCSILVDDENCPRLHTIIQNHFSMVRVLQGFKSVKTSHMPASLVRRSSVHLPVDETDRVEKEHVNTLSAIPETASSLLRPRPASAEDRSKWNMLRTRRTSIMAMTKRRSSICRQESLQGLQQNMLGEILSPKLESRISVA